MANRLRHAPSATLALWISFLLAVLAACFSHGYLHASDDLATLDQAGRWLGGLFVGFHPMHPPDRSPLWTAVLYCVLRVVRVFGVLDPAAQAFSVRLLQALAATSVVWVVGRHGLALSRPRAALFARWLTGSMCFMPFLFVRQLESVGCLPFLVAALYGMDPEAWRPAGDQHPGPLLAAFVGGISLGIAALVRYEILMFLPGLLAAMLLRKRLKPAGAALLGLAMPLALEGALGYVAWGRWFAPELRYLGELGESFSSAGGFTLLQSLTQGHLAATVLFVMPPLAGLLLYGAARGARSSPLLAAGSLTFLAGQLALPGTLWTDLVPVLPPLLLLAGLGLAREGTGAHLRGWRWAWAVSLAGNLLLLPLWLSASPHRNRIEPLRLLSRRADVNEFLVVQTDTTELDVPEFYMRPWKPYVMVSSTEDLAVARDAMGEGKYAVMYGMQQQIRWLAALREIGCNPGVTRFFGASPVEDMLHRLCGERDPHRVATVYRL